MASVDGESYVKASEQARTAMEIVSAVSTAAATAIAVKQLTLAEKYYSLAKEMREYWKGTFKPCETKAVAEACDTPMYTPQYDVVAGRWLATAKQQFKRAYDNIGITASRYCTGLTASLLRDATVAQAMATNDAINLAYRYEDGRKQIFDEIRWSRRHQMLAMGRDMLAYAQNYGDQANKIGTNLRDFAIGVGNNMRQTLRYDDVLRAKDDNSTNLNQYGIPKLADQSFQNTFADQYSQGVVTQQQHDLGTGTLNYTAMGYGFGSTPGLGLGAGGTPNAAPEADVVDGESNNS